MEIKNKVFSKESTLEKYITIVENAMPSSVCDIILDEYKKSNDWKFWDSQSEIIFLDEQTTNKKERKYINELITSSFTRLKFLIYLKKTYNIFLSKNYGNNIVNQKLIHEKSDLKKLKPNNKDGSIVTIIQLNDEYEGGEISFFNGELKIKQKKRSSITFPNNILYEYEILPLISGEKYFIISFLT